MHRLAADIAAYLEKLVASSQLPSYAYTIAYSGQQIAGFGGMTGAEQPRVPSWDTRFAVYSITKAATGLAALRLVQRGLIDLESPVGTYLDGWVETPKDVSDGPVRAIHLLSHTAGFTYGSRSGSVAEAYRRAGFVRSAPRWLSGRGLYRSFAGLPRLYPPGTGWSYSLASDVLGWLISEVCGASLGDVLRREVFAPLGMTEACLWTELHKDSDVATVLELRAGTWMPAVSAMADWRDVAAPASGGAAMVTSLRGLIQLASAYVEENPQFLSPDLWRLARTNLVPHGASLRSGYLSPLPGRTIDGVGYGAGVAVVYDGAAAGIPHSLGEIGWEGSTGCFFLANPRLGLSAAFMTNRYPHSAMPWWRALRELIYSRLPELM